MARTMKVGIVGYGVMGEMHGNVWSGMEGVELAAVAEPNPKRQKVCHVRYPKCPVFPGIKEMFGFGPKLDIVVIATHASYHVDGVLTALERGCHVICEKPMALTMDQCDTMVMAANHRKLKLAINHQSIFSRAVTVAEQKIKAGDMGDLYAIKAYGKGRVACSDLMEIAGHLLHLM